MMGRLADLRVDLVFGESIHRRGSNMGELEEVLGTKLDLSGFDEKMQEAFYRSASVTDSKEPGGN